VTAEQHLEPQHLAFPRVARSPGLEALSVREREVLGLVADGLRALPEKKESEGIPLRARIGFKNRAGREASTEWASRIRRICVHG
jgi:hypothetical protein